MKRLWGSAGLIAGLAAAGAAAAGDLDGRWVPPTGNVEIVFAPCGPGLCGTVARVMANHSMEGPGASKAAAPKIGMMIVTDLHTNGPGHWKGKLFDRERGKTYDCLLTPTGATMTVRAYVGLPAFGKSLIWTRARS